LDNEDEFFNVEDYENFEPDLPNTKVNFEEVAHNYLARVDKIHQQILEDNNVVLDFDDMSSEEEESHNTNVLEELFQKSTEPLFDGSTTSKLQFNIILMSLCTLFLVSHHYLDKILTYLKHDVLLSNNNCPKNSYEMKKILMKLGLSHENIHYCDWRKILYW